MFCDESTWARWIPLLDYLHALRWRLKYHTYLLESGSGTGGTLRRGRDPPRRPRRAAPATARRDLRDYYTTFYFKRAHSSNQADNSCNFKCTSFLEAYNGTLTKCCPQGPSGGGRGEADAEPSPPWPSAPRGRGPSRGRHRLGSRTHTYAAPARSYSRGMGDNLNTLTASRLTNKSTFLRVNSFKVGET